jgi:hypothetical protein
VKDKDHRQFGDCIAVPRLFVENLILSQSLYNDVCVSRKLLSRLSHSVVIEPVGHCTDISTAAALRLIGYPCYLSITDCVVAELEARFSYNSIALLSLKFKRRH